MRILLLVYFIIKLSTVFAQGGIEAFPFLNTPISARLSVLNQPIAIYDNDIEIGILNPSMINRSMHNKLSLNFVDYFADINLISIAYAFPFKDFGSIGVSVKSIGYGDFIETDISSQSLGTFGANEQIVSLGMSKQIFEKWSLGLNVKTLFSNLESYQSIAIANDLSLAYINQSKAFFMALLARNYGKQLSSYHSSKEDLPFQLDFGLSKKLEHLPFQISMGYQNIQKWNLLTDENEIQAGIEQSKLSDFSKKLFRHIDFGGELSIGKHIQLRMGYNPKRRQELKVESYLGMVGFSWGFGLQFSNFNLNYGRSTYHLHGSPNYFSFSTDLSKFYKKR